MTNEAIFRIISLYKTAKIGHFMKLCESPIEKRFLLSLIKYFETDFTNSYQISYEYDPLEDEELSGTERSRPTAKILNNLWTPAFIRVKNPVFEWRIYPQYKFSIGGLNYRIDFCNQQLILQNFWQLRMQKNWQQ